MDIPPALMVPRLMLSLHVSAGASGGGGGGGGGVGLLGLLHALAIHKTTSVQNSKRRTGPWPVTNRI
jgi:hypothetical protein